jgi:hypothetical protein
MKHQGWFWGISGLFSAGYIFFVYRLDSAYFFFKYAIAVSAFLSCVLTLSMHQGRYFSSAAARDFISATIQNILLGAGLILSGACIAGISQEYQAFLHFAAFIPFGAALLAAKVTVCIPKQKGEILMLVLLICASVLPFLVILALPVWLYFRTTQAKSSPAPAHFLANPDVVGSIVGNLFFTMSILYGFFVSLSYLFPHGLPVPISFKTYHVVPLIVAMGLLFFARRAVTFNVFIFNLVAAPAAMIPGYVVLPLAFLAFQDSLRPQWLERLVMRSSIKVQNEHKKPCDS